MLNAVSQSFQSARVTSNNQLMMPKAAHDHRNTLGCRLVGLEWRLTDMLRGSTLQIDWASYLNSKFDTARRDVNYLFLTAYPRHRAYMARSRP